MKAHQRKARLKRARQHQAYCKARDHQYNRRIQELNSWVAYSKRNALVENHRERDKAKNNQMDLWGMFAFLVFVVVVAVLGCVGAKLISMMVGAKLI